MYWDALFPAQGKKSDVLRKHFKLFDVFELITPLYIPMEARNFKILKFWILDCNDPNNPSAKSEISKFLNFESRKIDFRPVRHLLQSH